MSGSDHHMARLSAFLESLVKDYPDGAGEISVLSGVLLDPAEPVLCEFVRSMLLWESTTPKAAAAMKRIESRVVDFNELRVCLARELLEMLGERYPRAAERAQRLRAALNDLYSRAHAVTLEHLTGTGKREAWTYLESLEGVPPYVVARVMLLSLGGHAAPVDGRILQCLVAAGAVEEGTTAEVVAGTLERRVRAGEMVPTYLRLQSAADEGAAAVEAGRGGVSGSKGGKGSRKGEGAEGGGDARATSGRGVKGGTKPARNGNTGTSGRAARRGATE